MLLMASPDQCSGLACTSRLGHATRRIGPPSIRANDPCYRTEAGTIRGVWSLILGLLLFRFDQIANGHNGAGDGLASLDRIKRQLKAW